MNPSRRTSRIISPPPRNGGMASSSSSRPQSTPMPVGPQHLVAGEGDEVAPELGDVGGEVGHVLGAVDQQQRAGGVGGVGELADRGERAEHVGHGGDADAAWRRRAGGRGRSRSSVAVVGQRDPAQLDAPLLLQHEPRDDVGVVLDLGEHARRRRLARLARPHEWATRLSASVAFLVKTTSRGDGAPMKRGDLGRGRPRSASVASSAMRVDAAVHVGVGRLVVRRPSRRARPAASATTTAESR